MKNEMVLRQKSLIFVKSTKKIDFSLEIVASRAHYSLTRGWAPSFQLMASYARKNITHEQ